MNNYILVVKKPNKDYRVDSSSDDLRLVSERLDQLKSKIEFGKIFTLAELASDKVYVSDSVRQTAKSMSKFHFLPVFRVKLGFETNDKIISITHMLGTDLDAGPIDELDKVKANMIDMLNQLKIYDEFNNGKKFRIDKLKVLSCRFVGMDTWIPDPVQGFFSKCGHNTDSYIFESFLDYVKRHRYNKDVVVDDKYEAQSSDMTYLKYEKRTTDEYPIVDRVKMVDNIDDVVIDKKNKFVNLKIK